MKLRLRSLFVSMAAIVPALVLAPRASYPWAAFATTGYGGTGAETCWLYYDNGTSRVNNCGNGTTNTKKFYLPEPVWSWTAAYNVAVRLQGSYLQSQPWVSCVSKITTGANSNVSARATTAGDGSLPQKLSMGTVNGFTDGIMVLDCDATFGGKVISLDWY